MQYQHMTESLHDFHQLLLTARRAGCGDFVWCSWVADSFVPNPRSQSPAGGANIVALTVRGARRLLPWWREQKPQPMGRLFKEAMTKFQRGGIPMCYVMPPMGTPFPHLSGTSGMKRGFPKMWITNWGKAWTQPGTRAVSDNHYYGRRWLCHYQPQGHAEKLIVLGPPGHGPESWWLSRAPACIRPDALSVDASFITSYSAYAQDRLRVGVQMRLSGSRHRSPRALTSSAMDTEQRTMSEACGSAMSASRAPDWREESPWAPPRWEVAAARGGRQNPRRVRTLTTTESVDLSWSARAPNRTRWLLR